MPGKWNKVRDKNYSKGKEKGFWKKFIKKKLYAIEDPHNNHTIADQGCSWTTPLTNCLGAMFNGVLIRHPIFWEMRHFEKSQKKGTRKLRNKNYSKGKEKIILENVHPRKKWTQ